LPDCGFVETGHALSLPWAAPIAGSVLCATDQGFSRLSISVRAIGISGYPRFGQVGFGFLKHTILQNRNLTGFDLRDGKQRIMQWAKYLSVIAASMLKFIAGPLTGVALDLHWLETFSLTVAGMMLSVFIFTYLGHTLKTTLLRRFYKNRKLFTSRNRRIVRIWTKYGMAGVAFMTPLLLTPIGGTMIAASFGESRIKIFFYMFVSAVFWGLIFTLIIDAVGHEAFHRILN
jgi:hypothetical protein